MNTRICIILLAVSLAACNPQQPQDVPAPAAPDNPAPADPTTSPAAPAQPAPPTPTDPSPSPKPTAQAPAVDSMTPARPGAKMSVAVDLRYQFAGASIEGQPVTL